MKTFSDIAGALPSIETCLRQQELYRAHLSDKRPPERLHEHIQLVLDYFFKLVEVHGLEKIIDDTITQITSSSIASDRESFTNIVKEMFCAVMLFHDFGKINENFQYDKMQNVQSFHKILNNPFETGHSKLSAILFTAYYLNIINQYKTKDEIKIRLAVMLVNFGYNILRHHASHLNEPKDGYNDLDVRSFLDFANRYLSLLNINCYKQLFDSLSINLEEWYGLTALGENEFSLYALLKLNYSLLTASDYLATSHYMMQWPEILTDFGVLTNDQKQKIISTVKETKGFNKDLFLNYDAYKSKSFDELMIKDPDNLNILRQKMAAEVIESLKSNQDEKLFYLECPTGGGKTNLSILSISHFLEMDLKNGIQITKIFYVFPFMTLITQTAKVLKETLGLTSLDMIELHSRASFHKKEEDSADGFYGNERLNYIDYLFNHYSVTLLSHVKFFDIIKTSSKEQNYLFHRLVNSVVIIDELQSYNPKEWDKIIYFISRMSSLFNIRFILMSATLPKIDQLSTCKSRFINLIPDSIKKYYSNQNFRDRVIFDFELSTAKIDKLEDIADIVIDKSAEYSEKNTFNPGGVRTIIEFIYKKTASNFYDIIRHNSRSSLFNDIFVLSGTILEPRRREIIAFLKNPDNKHRKTLLISTQVVEAGVDIDMDIGFKDRSLIDSDEQLAGRINRNAIKSGNSLYLFRFDDPHVIYGKDLRYKATRDDITQEDYIAILQKKEFDRLYEKVNNNINRLNKTQMMVNFQDYLQFIKNTNFKDIDKNFKLIDEDSISVFVPCSVPIKVPETDETNFSEPELSVIKKYGININDLYINGQDVWNIYEKIITTHDKDFISRMIQLKTIGAIISKFIFSANRSMLKELSLTFGEEKFGFFYLSNYSEVYDYKSGIKDSKLKESNFI